MFDDILQMLDGDAGAQPFDGAVGDPGTLGISAQSMPNIFGGQTIYHDGGGSTTTVPNVFGGQDFYHNPVSFVDTELPLDIPESTGGVLNEPVVETSFDSGDEVYLDPHTLTENAFDPVNNVVVHGNVEADAQFVHGQTTDSCALMAQEQFIEKYYDVEIPEQALVDFATRMNVYSPGHGTDPMGWDMLLNHFGIDHECLFHASVDDLVSAVKNGNDVFLAVDASPFYNDPTIPSGSGHAVVVTGDGTDRQAGEVRGFYINDTNHPGTPLFKTIADLEECWHGQMISVPDPALSNRGEIA